MGHRLGLATRTQISVCKSPFPVLCENGSAETIVAEAGRNPVAECGVGQALLT